MTDVIPAGLLGYLPLPKEAKDLSDDQLSAWSVIDIKCTLIGLSRAAAEIGDALLALPFNRYEDLSVQPYPPGVECTFLTDEDGKRMRIMRQYDLANSRDLFQLTVIVK